MSSRDRARRQNRKEDRERQAGIILMRRMVKTWTIE